MTQIRSKGTSTPASRIMKDDNVTTLDSVASNGPQSINAYDLDNHGPHTNKRHNSPLLMVLVGIYNYDIHRKTGKRL